MKASRLLRIFGANVIKLFFKSTCNWHTCISSYLGIKVHCIGFEFYLCTTMNVTKTGTGNLERESGNNCTAVTSLRIQIGRQKKRKGSKREQFGEIWGSVTIVNVNFYKMCFQMTSKLLWEESLVGISVNKHEISGGEKIESALFCIVI